MSLYSLLFYLLQIPLSLGEGVVDTICTAVYCGCGRSLASHRQFIMACVVYRRVVVVVCHDQVRCQIIQSP